MRIVTIVILCLTLSPTVGLCDEMLVDGDFESGGLRGYTPKYWQPEEMAPYPMELPPGWIEAGPDNITGWQGGKPVPVQFFNSDAPMYVYDISYDKLGTRSIKRAGVARDVAPKEGYSVGWTLSGLNAQGDPWISQIVRIPPGKYTVHASWDALACNQTNPGAKQMTGGVFMHNPDRDLERSRIDEPVLSYTTWHEESQGKWVTHSVTKPLETKTGFIEVRLGFIERSTDLIPTDKYSYAAFDNLVLEFVHTGSTQEMTEESR